MFKSTVYMSLIYCINLHWIALHVVKRYFTRDLSVFGIYSAVAEDNILFSEEKWSECSLFFYRLLFSYGAWNFGLEKTRDAVELRMYDYKNIYKNIIIPSVCHLHRQPPSCFLLDQDFQMWNDITFRSSGLISRYSLYLF